MLGVVEDEGGGGVDRHRPRVRRGVRLLAGVDLEGGETLHLRLGVVARLVSLSVSPPPTGSGPGVRGAGSPSWSPLPFARWGRDGGQVRPPPGPPPGPPGPLGPLGPLPRGDGPPSASDGRALPRQGATAWTRARPAATARGRGPHGRGAGGAVRGGPGRPRGAPRRAVRWSAAPARPRARARGGPKAHAPWAAPRGRMGSLEKVHWTTHRLPPLVWRGGGVGVISGAAVTPFTPRVQLPSGDEPPQLCRLAHGHWNPHRLPAVRKLKKKKRCRGPRGSLLRPPGADPRRAFPAPRLPPRPARLSL